MKHYKVRNYIACDGKRYAPDDTVEMPEEKAEALIALGYLEPLIGEQQSEDEKSEDEKPEGEKPAPKRRRKQQNTED